MMLGRKICKNIFLYFCIPYGVILLVYAYLKGGLTQDDQFLIIFLIAPAIPYIFYLGEDLERKAHKNFCQQFKNMGATEFLNYMEEFKKIPLGKERAMKKDAYAEEYYRRYSKDIFHQIPLPGER